MVYQFNADMPPDSEFEPGDLRFVVAGNHGRWLDARRTPFRIVEVTIETGFFAIELLDFEDAGACWEVPLERVDRCQFSTDCATADSATVAEYRRVVARLSQPLRIPDRPDDRIATEARIAEVRHAVAAWLQSESSFLASGETLDLAASTGSVSLQRDLQRYLSTAGLSDIEAAFAEQYVRNADSGELVKGHRIVLAELGLAAFEGTTVRDPTLFDGAWSRTRRADHILHRLAFVREVFERLGHRALVLYRGLSCEGQPQTSGRSGFVSATFSRDVALSHFDHPDRTTTGALYRQTVPVYRLFMSFFETSQMNDRFREAEAVLIQDDRGLF